MFGMEWSIADLVMEKRLRWLGHLGRMDDCRLPKKMLFGELRKRRAFHGPKRRWKDLVMKDLQAIGAKENWYQLCQDRKGWYDQCCEGVDEVASCRRKNVCAANNQKQSGDFVCVCGRSFHRQGDLTRHNCFCKLT